MYENEDCDDLIILDERNECMDGIFEDFQIIDADIIDYGISEDEYEEVNPVAASPLAPPAASELTVTVSNVPKVNETKCLSIKIVDCFKYPWYYKKYREQILERKYFDNVQSIARFVLQCNNAKNRYSPTLGCDNTLNSLDEGELNKIRNKSVISDIHLKTPTDDKALNLNEKIKELSSEAELNSYNHKKNNKKEKTRNQINSNEIVDIRKNKGLVGIKIQRMSLEVKASEYISKKDKISELKENDKHKCKKYSSSCAKAVDKTIQKFDTAIQKPQPKSYHYKSNDKNLYSKPNHTNKTAGLKCSLKNLSPKILQMVKQIMPLNRDKSIRNICHSRNTDIDLKTNGVNIEKTTPYSNNTSSNLLERLSTNLNVNNAEKLIEDHNKIIRNSDTRVIPYEPMPKSKKNEMLKRKDKEKSQKSTRRQEVLHMNKFTRKVLKIKGNTQQMNRKTSTKKTFKENYIVSNKASPKEKSKLKAKEAINLSKYLMPFEKTEHIQFNTNTNNTRLSKEIDTVNKNNVMKKQNIDVYTDFRKSMLKINSDNYIVVPENSNQEWNVSSKSNGYSQLNPTVGSKNLQVRPIISSKVPRPNENDNLVRTHPLLSKTLNQEPKPPRLPQTKSNRKQKLKVLSAQNIGRIEEYMKLYLNSQETVQPFDLPPLQKSLENLDVFHNHINTKDYVKVDTSDNTKVQPSISALDTWINPAMIIGQSPPDSAKQCQNYWPIPTIIGGINQQSVNNIGNEHIAKIVTINSNMLQNTPTSAAIIKPIQIPINAFSNTPIKDVPTKSRFINVADSRVNISKPIVTRPVPSNSNIPLKHQHLPRKNMQQKPNYIFPFSQGNPQRMPMYNGNNLWSGNYYIKNNYIQQPVYTVDNPHRIDRIVDNTKIPPGICDVHPNNVNWAYSYGLQPQPPPPPPRSSPPPLPRCIDSSVIGENGGGFVKKINIPTLLVNTQIDGKAGKVMRQNFNDDTAPQNSIPTVTVDTPVLSKTEMMAELEKAVVIDSPVKKELKRPLSCGQIKQMSPLRKCRPRSISKKLNLSERAYLLLRDRQKTTPVLSKTEMMAELEKAVFDSPVNKDLLSCEQVKEISPLRKCRPGPLSEKLKLSDRASSLFQDTSQTTPVLSKTEMMVELEKAVVIESPVKKELLTCGQIKQISPLRNSRPGPLSKKLKLNDRASVLLQDRQKTQPHKGYSPPILPIPSYQNIMAETKTTLPTFEKPFSVTSADVNKKRVNNNFQNVLANKVITFEAKEDEITLHEYKMRNTNNRSAKIK